jgi:serine/threonine-protein kinase HipA
LQAGGARLSGTTENEAFVMRLAAAVGLEVAPVELRTAEGRPFLLVGRYDRRRDEAGFVRRLHQEDFCQALGVLPETKYAGEGGPTFKECFDLVRRISARPAVDVLKLLDAAIFNLIVGNADAHGKNFSILYGEDGPRLAPLYDLLSTIAYPELAPKMAMRLGKRATLQEMDADGWKAFAKEAGVGWPLLRRRVGELGDKINAHAGSVGEELGGSKPDSGDVIALVRLVTDRAQTAQKSLG